MMLIIIVHGDALGIGKVNFAFPLFVNKAHE